MDFLIAGIVIAVIAWIALRPRFGISQRTYLNRTTLALAELGIASEQLPPELAQLFERERQALWEEKARQANPYEMACSFFVKACVQHPQAVQHAARADRAPIHAMVKAVSWRGEEIGSKFADEFMLDIKLQLTDGQLLQNEFTG